VAGPPNGRLGLVQAQDIIGRAAYSQQLIWGGLLRVRVPGAMISQGEDAWRPSRFSDLWWMETLHRLGIPCKAVVELSSRASDEEHAAHAVRLMAHTHPAVVIVGNELNTAAARPGADPGAVIERYLDRYAAIRAAVKAVSPDTPVQLYGEAYDGHPSEPDAFLRRLLLALRRRALPPPDLAGIHVYDHAGVLPERVAAYRRLFADYDLRLPLSVEELGPRQGVVDRWDELQLARRPAEDGAAYPNRLAELRDRGWISEAEQAELVAQQLATAFACADQAQIFCAMDFPAELEHRRGLVSGPDGRLRPALRGFLFLQRLLRDPAEVHWRPPAEQGGVAALALTRQDGLGARVCWSAPVGDEAVAPARTMTVPPYTFVCDARGELVQPPLPVPAMLDLPAATTPEAAGAVRILV
jgi:hypothetical protein